MDSVGWYILVTSVASIAVTLWFRRTRRKEGSKGMSMGALKKYKKSKYY